MMTYFRLLAFTGMRKNEISALRWSDIDFKKGQITVNQTLAKGEDNKLIFQTPKTKKECPNNYPRFKNNQGFKRLAQV